MKTLIFNAQLNHKQNSYETTNCIVEKIIPIDHFYFENLKKNMLKDNYFISNNKQLMFQDNENAHCMMFVDYATGDGMLIESEGADYARKSQFIPNAKAIISQNEITGAEKELHRRLKEIVDYVSEKSHTGENHFCLQDILAEKEFDVNELLRSAVSEMLAQRDDILQVDVFSQAIEKQADLRVQTKEMKEMKFVCPLKITQPCTNEDSNYDEQISNRQATTYCNEINDFIQSYAEPEEKNRGLMAYEDRNQSLNENVFSVFPTVEVVDDELKGVITCKVNAEISEQDIKELKERITGQMSDGWGEGVEQHEISTPDGDIYVSFWNYENWSLEEMKTDNTKEENTMNGFMSKSQVEYYKTHYPAGTRIEVDFMEDPYHPIESGTKGTVKNVDDVGTLHCVFDNGRAFGICPDTDSFHTIQPEQEQVEESDMDMSM